MATIGVITDGRKPTTFLADLLSDRGGDAVVCFDGVDILDHIDQWTVDLFIIDLKTSPDRWNCHGLLQALDRGRVVPVIICAAVNDEIFSEQRQLRERGVVVLEKPFDLEELYGVVDEALGRGIASDQTRAGYRLKK